MHCVLNFYKHDARFGDGLFKPQRWCHQQWSCLTGPLDPAGYRCWEVAKRVGKAVFLMLPTLGSYLLTVPGVVLKAFQRLPSSAPPTLSPGVVVKEPDWVGTADNPYYEAPFNEIARQDPINKGARAFSVNVKCQDVMGRIAGFLGTRSLLSFRLTCRGINNAVISCRESIFSPYLITVWGFAGVQKVLVDGISQRAYLNYYASSPEDCFNVKKQVEAYRQLRQLIQGQDMDCFFRLMPGGPVGFEAIHTLDPKDAALLDVGDLPGALVRGKDKEDKLFFALRLKVTREKEEPTFIALVFIKFIRGWIQQANTFLLNGHISLGKDGHLITILRLIKKFDGPPDLSIFNVPGQLAWTAASVE